MKTIIALFGESGSGKDYVAEMLKKEYNYYRLIRMTSRKMRQGETQGNPYFFKSELELHKDITDHIDEYLEVGIFNNFLYATHQKELKSDINVGCFDIDAVEQLLENKEINTLPIYLWAPAKMRIMRQLVREEQPDTDEICRRYFDDKKKYHRINNFNYFKVSNTANISDTLIDIKKIVDNNKK